MIANITNLLPAAGSTDSLARSMAQQALDRVATVTPVVQPWFDDGPTAAVTSETTLAGLSRVRDLAGAEESVYAQAPTSASADVTIGAATSLAGEAAWPITTVDGARVVVTAAPGFAGTVESGDTLTVEFTYGDGGARADEIGVQLATPSLATGGERAVTILFAMDGTWRAPGSLWNTATGALGADVDNPENNPADVTVTAVDQGWHVRIVYRFTGGPYDDLFLGVRLHGEFTTPALVTAFAPMSPATAWAVTDPAGSDHCAEVPMTLSLVVAKPAGDGTIVEMIGDNGTGAGGFVARLELLGGALWLAVSEDSDASRLTASLPPTAWPEAGTVELTLGLLADEAILFVDGYAATGLPVSDPPTGLACYRLGGRRDGRHGLALAVQSAADAHGRQMRSDGVRLMRAEERAALPAERPGRLYAEWSA
jgi:hypothetical protein